VTAIDSLRVTIRGHQISIGGKQFAVALPDGEFELRLQSTKEQIGDAIKALLRDLKCVSESATEFRKACALSLETETLRAKLRSAERRSIWLTTRHRSTASAGAQSRPAFARRTRSLSSRWMVLQ
jgi:hypothetical protein